MNSGLHTVVCLKVVPKSEEVQVDRERKTLERGRARSEINPPDMNALEMALALKDRHGGRVSLLAMGPPFFAPYLRVGLAMGADDAYLLTDRGFAGADTLATSLVLARAASKMGDVDLVLCGEESSDGATAQVPPGIAAWLEAAQATYALELDYDPARRHALVRREVREGEEDLDVPLPAVVSVKTGANEPRFMDPERWAPLDGDGAVVLWSASDLSLAPEEIGSAGSPTSVAGLRETRDAGAGRRRKRIGGRPEEAAHLLYQEIRRYLRGARSATESQETGPAGGIGEPPPQGGTRRRQMRITTGAMIGRTVVSLDGVRIGRVKAVSDRYFEVTEGAHGQPNYWLAVCDIASPPESEGVTLAFDASELEDHKAGHEGD